MVVVAAIENVVVWIEVDMCGRSRRARRRKRDAVSRTLPCWMSRAA